MAVQGIVKESQYLDSVTLMTIAKKLRTLPDVEDAALVMGTDANKGLLQQADMYPNEVKAATANDLILVIKGGEQSLERAIAQAELWLTSRDPAAQSSRGRKPKTVRSAVRLAPAANLALVSVSGQYAAQEAWAALYQGLHVLLFSDNVSLEDEVELKRYAIQNDLLMLGPGAGTTILNGAALGFSNNVPKGPVGIVSAAGTGLQEVSSLLARQGVGVSQGIGVGGRDLHDEVGGMMMLHALAALQEDPETETIVAISKLPSDRVAERVLENLSAGKKPTVVIFMGEDLAPPAYVEELQGGKIHLASTLDEAALAAAMMVHGSDPQAAVKRLEQEREVIQEEARTLRAGLAPEQQFLRGLFSGGTLCEEAIRIWRSQVGQVWSNTELDKDRVLPGVDDSIDHTALDLGDEAFTVGRLHPMIDYDLRIRRLTQEADDPSVALIQMDVVLGFGSHPNPSGELVPAIENVKKASEAAGRKLIIVLSITGTDADPQNLSQQRETLERAGAVVKESNAAASWLAVSCLTP
jgi:succinyl-CoA synthetase alpha subunit